MADDYEVKGTLLRGYFAFLDEERRCDRVSAAAPPDVQALFARRPMATDWVAGKTLEAMVDTIVTVDGPAIVRRMVVHSLNGTVARVIRPLGEGLVRLFGGTPHTMFSRMETINAPLFRGLKYQYTRHSDASCTVEIRYPRAARPTASLGWEAALDMILRGTAREPRPLRTSWRDEGRTLVFEMNW